MRAVELHLRPEGGAFPGVDEALADLDGVSRESLIDFDWRNDGTYTLLYRFTGPDPDALRDLLEGHGEVMGYEVVPEEDQRIYAFMHVSEREAFSELMAIAEENALLLDPPFRYTEDGVRVTVAGSDESLQTAFAAANERMHIDVESTGEFVPDQPAYLDRMTDRQYEALVTAHEMGYYETPRAVSFEEVADELGCAPSTANELLRRAEAVLVDAMLG